MTQVNNLVADLQEDHKELFDLMKSLKNVLAVSKRREVKQILDRIDEMTSAHFKFEEDYLFPRMLRLTRQLAEKLSLERQEINGFIVRARGFLRQDRLNKDRLSDLSEILPLLSKHLKDCGDLVFIADKFGDEEKNELGRKFKEYRGIKKGGGYNGRIRSDCRI